MSQPQSIWIAYKTQRIHALRFGRGKRLLIIFHGFADRAELFLKFEAELSPYFDVVAVDMPYHGRTEWAPKVFKPHHVTAVVEGILQETGYQRFSLMAHSMGGFVALKTYSLLPHLVDALIMLAPGGIYKALPFNPYLFNGPVRRFFRFTMGSRLMPSVLRASRKLRLLHRSFYEFIDQHFANERRRHRLFNSWVSLYYFDLDLPRIQALLVEYQTDITFFYGTQDKITPVKYAQDFCEAVPQAEIQLVEDNHFFIRSPLKEALGGWLNQKYGMKKEEMIALLTEKKYSRHSAESQMTEAQFLERLKQFYLFYFEEAYIEEHLAVPADCLVLLEALEGGWMRGQHWAYLGDRDGALAMTDDFYQIFGRDFFERKQAKAPITNDTLWLKIGYWSDKHDWIICVDKRHPQYGKVIDAYDDHPFLHEDFLDDGIYANVRNFLLGKEEGED